MIVSQSPISFEIGSMYFFLLQHYISTMYTYLVLNISISVKWSTRIKTVNDVLCLATNANDVRVFFASAVADFVFRLAGYATI